MTDEPDRPQVRSAADLMRMDFPAHPRRRERPVEIDRTPVRIRGEPLDEVWWRGWQWAVTAYGLECLDGTYPIEAKRLAESIDRHGWPEHMGGKVWCDPEDFATAWLVALAMHGTRVPGKAAIRDALGRARIDPEAPSGP
jgi:hypothetical protein